MRARSLLSGLVLSALATTTIACNDNENNENPPSGGVVVGTTQVVALDNAAEIEWEGGIFWAVANTFDPVVGVAVIDTNTAIDDIAKNIGNVIGPSGCVNNTTSPGMITLRFQQCTPPFGQVNTTGRLAISVSQNGNALQIDAQALTLKATQASLMFMATALYSASGDGRTLTVTTSSSGTGPSGALTTRSGQYTMNWTAGADCATVDGNVASTKGGSDTTSFGSFVVCRTGCPLSGSVTHVDPASGVSVTTVYNGTATATFTASDGSSGTTTITCF
ncbi:MAG TPA: hypothetical protein VN947_20580 [Polyangia bacterium]|nr:hypothetical protein [Polyangia bacterium]